ncbi:MAG: hypothetical protein ACI9OU_002806, partial [Candidatus Promineifilaceae bacterium]
MKKLLALALLTPFYGAMHAQAVEPPPPTPVHIGASNVTHHSATILWSVANFPHPGTGTVFEVWLRTRPANALAPEWGYAGSARHTALDVIGLQPSTVYDIRVELSQNGVKGAYGIRENAFETLAPPDINHPPTPPVHLVVSEVGQTQTRLQWGPSTDPETNNIVYMVHLRHRTASGLHEWQPRGTTGHTNLLVADLFP